MYAAYLKKNVSHINQYKDNKCVLVFFILF